MTIARIITATASASVLAFSGAATSCNSDKSSYLGVVTESSSYVSKNPGEGTVFYIRVKFTDGKTERISLPSEDSYPGCVVGAAYPACKDRI
jgi:hypothetical protein